MNFNTFGKVPEDARLETLERCADMIEKNRMPTRDYLRLHPEARLQGAEKERLTHWLRKP